MLVCLLVSVVKNQLSTPVVQPASKDKQKKALRLVLVIWIGYGQPAAGINRSSQLRKSFFPQ